MNTLIGIDIQNDFVTGRLANPLAQKVLPKVIEKVKNWDGPIFFTQDTHNPITFKFSMEGKLPIHCCPHIDENGWGWEIVKEVLDAAGVMDSPYDKPEECLKSKLVDTIEKTTFGALDWLTSDCCNKDEAIVQTLDQADSITVIGFVSEICVIANLILLRAKFPNKRIIWDSTCSAGIPNEKGEQPGHEAAKLVAKAQMIEVIE